MKKLLTILLALSCAACVLMFAACGTEEEPSDGSDANTTVSDGDAAEITTEGETPDVTTSPEGGSEEPVTTPSSDLRRPRPAARLKRATTRTLRT